MFFGGDQLGGVLFENRGYNFKEAVIVEQMKYSTVLFKKEF
jgi:hypothetical protein